MTERLAILIGTRKGAFILSGDPGARAAREGWQLSGPLCEGWPINHFRYDPASGEIQSILRVPAGYGKVAVLDELRAGLPLSHDRIVYVGDGSSDVHVMMHVNRLDGLTIAVSENKFITPIAKRTILSEDALSVMVPIMEEIAGWDAARIRALFEAHGFVLQDWEKVRTDSLTIRETGVASLVAG